MSGCNIYSKLDHIDVCVFKNAKSDNIEACALKNNDIFNMVQAVEDLFEDICL